MERPETTVPTYSVCGVPIAAVSTQVAAQTIVDQAAMNHPFQVHLCNAYTLSLVDKDPLLRNALRQADLNLPDGAPVAWLGRRYGVHSPVRGPGLVAEVARQGATKGLRHYFYGGAPGVAEKMADTLRREVNSLEIAGIESPPYRPMTQGEVNHLSQRISDSRTHVVWVGLGTPKQDYLVPQLSKRIEAVVVPVGAAFDFWAGHVQEAPALLHGSGLEWLYRLSKEPKRLWRRYLFGNPQFMLSVVRHRLAERREQR